MSGIVDVNTVGVHASMHSNWLLVRVGLADGSEGVGEATCNGLDEAIAKAVAAWRSRLVGLAPTTAREALHADPQVGDLAAAAAVSALDQALWDLEAQLAGAPLRRLFDRDASARVRLYANLNRGLGGDRTPESFARAADRAANDGFGAAKIAPFDGVTASDGVCDSHLYLAGLARVDAVRAVLPHHVRLMVDCHWRFDSDSAAAVVADLAARGVSWVEAPLPENRPDLWTTDLVHPGVDLAGGEYCMNTAAFEALLSTGVVNVVMPDVKYCGGVTGVREVIELARGYGARVSPHNPSGPVGSLASAHALAGCEPALLEFAVGECPWRSELVGGAERVEDGHLILDDEAGLGVTLSAGILAEHPPAAVSPTLGPGLMTAFWAAPR